MAARKERRVRAAQHEVFILQGVWTPLEATLTSGGGGRPRWGDAEHTPVYTSARAPSAPGPKGVFILQTPVQGFRERVFSSQLFPFPGPADFRKWISHFQNTVPTDRQSKLCTDRSEEECWQGRGGVPAKIAPVDVQVVSFKDNIEIGGRGEGPFALVVRCSTVRRLPRATLGWRGGGAIQCFPKRQNWMSREGKISIIFGPR